MNTEVWTIEVVEYSGGRVVKQITCDHGERQADRIERGLNINLNHDRFYTRVIPPDDKRGRRDDK